MKAYCTQNTDRECREEDCCLENNIFKVETYTGTIESAQDLIRNLRLEGKHFFNVFDKTIINQREGFIYSPGDCYQYAINEEFKAI